MKNNTDTNKEAEPTKLSRRKMLSGLAAGGAALGASGLALSQQRGDAMVVSDQPAPASTTTTTTDTSPSTTQPVAASNDTALMSRFTQMFDEQGFQGDLDDELLVALANLGAPGGPLDANDPLERGARRLLNDDDLSINNPDNGMHGAGTTFLGQFLDHDLTRDSGSTLGQRTSLARSVNLRSAQFDLDSVYGGGPAESPDLYEPNDPVLFRVESGGRFEDLPRDATGAAIIGDGRNDENLIIAGIHVAFLMFHNAVVERLRASTDLEGDLLFDQARQSVVWHYQWIIVNEYLPQIIGQDLTNQLLANGNRFWTPDTPSIPVEFQTSAYRFGHSMIRPSYQANNGGNGNRGFTALVFDPDEFGQDNPDDMSGGHRAARRFISWENFFDFNTNDLIAAKRIDTTISTPLFNLPMGTIDTSRGEPIGPTSLATRNLLRHITWSIPSGQTVADLMGVDRLSNDDLSDLNDAVPQLVNTTPLWLYILREADVIEDGVHLGPVGGTITGEVFVGLLRLDPNSILNAGSTWRPDLPSRLGEGDFEMADLLTIAGVDPDSRDQ